MTRVPKEIKELVAGLDGQYAVTRAGATKHWAIVRRSTGKVIYTLSTNETRHQSRSAKNQRATMKRRGLLS